MNPQKRKYYVVIVHYGSPRRTKQALASISTSLVPPNEVIVVDHAVQPLNDEAQRGRHGGMNAPARIVIRPEKNRGFAAGVNLALGALLARGAQGSDIVVVMNNDVTVYPETFKELRLWWQANPADALVGVTTEEAGGRVAGLGYVDLLTGRTRFRRPRNFYVPYIHGSFFSAPFSVLMKLRGLTEKYFLYWEDVELGVRAARQHIPLAVSDKVKVRHQQQAGKEREQQQRYYLVRNGALFLEQETPVPWQKIWWLRNRLRFVYHTLRRRRDPVVRRALADARRGITGPKTLA